MTLRRVGLVGGLGPGVDFVAITANTSRVIFAGTELPLLLPGAELAGLPVLDTTALHVAAIVARLS